MERGSEKELGRKSNQALTAKDAQTAKQDNLSEEI
jgi:hypothetical protein